MGYRIGIDVGGTFTDFSLVCPDGRVLVTKSPTTPMDEATGVLAGIEELAKQESKDLDTLLKEMDVLVHSTTTADNTLITMRGTSVGLITTDGHRDDIEFRRGFRENIWDPAAPRPTEITKRRFRISVKGRFDHQGN